MGFEGYPIFRQTHFVKAWTQQFRNYPAVSLLVTSASYCFSLPCCWMSHFLLINIPTSCRSSLHCCWFLQISQVKSFQFYSILFVRSFCLMDEICISMKSPFCWWISLFLLLQTSNPIGAPWVPGVAPNPQFLQFHHTALHQLPREDLDLRHASKTGCNWLGVEPVHVGCMIILWLQYILLLNLPLYQWISYHKPHMVLHHG